MQERLSHFLEHIRGLGGIRATVLSLITAAALYLSGKVFDIYDEQIISGSGISRPNLLQFLLALVIISAVIFIGHEWSRARRRKAVPDFTEVFHTEVEPIHFRTAPLGRAISETFIPALFPSPSNPSGAETMPFEEIEKLGALNRYTSVGAKADGRIVGYVSLWPVKDEIGNKLLSGKMTDSDLIADHAFPETDRHLAKFLVIPGFGVLHPRRSVRVRAAVVLFHAAKKMIAREYLKGNRRGSLTLIAFPYSKEGKEWCEKLDIVPTGNHAAYSDGTIVPVCSRKLTLLDLI